jgi:photosystem II stability/assembly factor-like uncharacterized protein
MAELNTTAAEGLRPRRGGKLDTLKSYPERSRRTLDTLNTLLFYLAILFFFIGFQFSDTMLNGWYQQFMPNIEGRSITDVFFLDSLTGWSVTNATNQNPDTTYVLKTTNGGDNWVIQYRKLQTGGGFSGYFRVYFLNQNTGYACDVKGIDKTINGGVNWVSLNAPQTAYLDMSVLNTDTIWIVTPDNFMGGVFRTTNGGASWDRQLNLGSQNPNHIYMFNGRIGFIGKDQVYLRRTSDSGLNWQIDTTGNDSGFRDMYFIDSLTGWKTYINMRKTTNGGLNWFVQTTPQGGIIQSSFIFRFSNVNQDILWGVGGYVLYPNNQIRGIVYRTINGGTNWLFQIPDTSIHIGSYGFCDFVNPLIGWAYVGIHTTTGGDPVFYTSNNQISTNVPDKFYLGQNYPNPFNPITKISYELSRGVGTGEITSYVVLSVYDITGKKVIDLVNQKQSAGTYKVTFDGTNYSSGVYFYSLIVDGKLIDTKKMVLIK